MIRSPLRYPGGKALLTPFLIELFKSNGLHEVVYAEPYAGGAGAAINLLFLNAVKNVLINDANIGVYSFWYYLLTEPGEFIRRIDEIPVTLEQWRIEHELSLCATEPSLELGVATFFLSRTNRSGVLSAGPIGGNTIEKQNSATYKIDCRFNKENLVKKLRQIANYAEQIHVTNMDAIDFLRQQTSEVFVYLDPPYYTKGKCLYMNHYTHDDHKKLADYLQNEACFKWLLSYDDVKEIRSLYDTLELYRFPLLYTVQGTKLGMELMTHSVNLVMPDSLMIARAHSKNIPLEKLNNQLLWE